MGKAILIFMLSSLSFQCVACTCGPKQSFFDGISKEKFFCLVVYDTTTYDEMIDGRHVQLGYFEVIDTFTSINTKIGNEIVVTGQDGLNCGDDLDYWEKGDTVVLGLRGGFYREFARDTFHLDACSLNFLTIENSMAEGLSIPELKQKIVDIITSVDYPFLSLQIQLSPNPTNADVYLQSENLRIKSVRIFDMTGREISKENWKRKSDRPIDLSKLKRGLYNLLIETDQGSLMRKVAKL